jgi:uncharacterized membrane protein YfhO
VVVEGPAEASCRSGRARRTSFGPGREQYAVEADGAGYLVTRDSHARGWRAWVDGQATPVLRAQGKHRAVAVPPGRHDVVLRYRPPGLWMGCGVSGLALCAALALWARAGPSRRRP